MAARAWKRANSGEHATYELVSLPLYLAANVGRILRDGEPRPRER
jgi:hypothetical protein